VPTKVTKVRWVDEVDRAHKLTEPLGIQWIAITPEISDSEMQEFRAEDPDLGPLVEWLTDGQTPSADVLREQSLKTKSL